MDGFVELLCILGQLCKSTLKNLVLVFEGIYYLLFLLFQLLQLIFYRFVILFSVLHVPQTLVFPGRVWLDGPSGTILGQLLVLPGFGMQSNRIFMLLQGLPVVLISSPFNFPDPLSGIFYFLLNLFLLFVRGVDPEGRLLQLHLLQIKIFKVLHLLILLNLLLEVLNFLLLLLDVVSQIYAPQLLKLIDVFLVLLYLVVCFLYLRVKGLHLLPQQCQTILILLIGRRRGRLLFFFFPDVCQALGQGFNLSLKLLIFVLISIEHLFQTQLLLVHLLLLLRRNVVIRGTHQ